MEQPTHYLTVTLGIDFAEVFSPERILGVKYLLGVQSDEEVINALSSNIFLDVENSLTRHKDFTKVVGVDLNPVPMPEVPEDIVHTADEADEGDDVSEDWVQEEPEQDCQEEPTADESDVHEEYLDLDTLALESENQDDDIEDDDSLSYDSYGIALVDSISNDIFKIEAFLGNVTSVFLKEYSYRKTVENEFGEDIDIRSFDALRELNETVDESIDDVHSEDYVIRFKDQQGNVKFGKRKIDKE